MRTTQLFIFLSACLFVQLLSCNNPNSTVTEFGTIDTAAIAMDTLMQKAIESSYEHHSTLIQHEKLVYDIIGWGETYNGQLAIVRRAADNRPDTLLQTNRSGAITKTFLTDLDADGNKEVLLLLLNKAQKVSALSGAEVSATAKPLHFTFSENESPAADAINYNGSDALVVNEGSSSVSQIKLGKRGLELVR